MVEGHSELLTRQRYGMRPHCLMIIMIVVHGWMVGIV